MNRIQKWLFKKIVDKNVRSIYRNNIADTSKTTTNNNLGLIATILTRIGIRNGDVGSTDFEDPEYDFSVIATAYDTDSYIRQGIDKYIDQIFKEGWQLYGTDESIVEYINARLKYIAEASKTPTDQLLIEIAEDVVKYSNCVIAKARSSDPTVLPQGYTIQGVNGAEPVAGYYCINLPSLKVKRDQNGTVQGWQQEVSGASTKLELQPDDVIHIYYKREKGNAFGTPLLQPVLDDVRALRQAEENVLKLMYRNIYPFYHVAVGDSDSPGTPSEVNDVQESINDMDVEGGLVTTNRVSINAVAANQVVNAEPYIRYMEDRVFSGLGVPAVLFGRGDTANRSTSDSMSTEMGDRIKAIQKTIEMFVNFNIIKELLIEGGYNPIDDPNQNVYFRFKDNDLDTKIKNETHAVYLYEHNAITEDEMRKDLGRDIITDRTKMHIELITRETASFSNTGESSSSSSNNNGSKETNNKEQPENQNGKNQSPKTNKDNLDVYKSLMLDIINDYSQIISDNIKDKDFNKIILNLRNIKFNTDLIIEKLHINVTDQYIEIIDRYFEDAEKHVINMKNKNEKSECIDAVMAVSLDLLKNIILNTK